MQPTKTLRLLCLLLVILPCRPEAGAQGSDNGNYRYPYQNPLIATATVALMNGRESMSNVDIRDLEINVIAGRDNVYLLEGMGKLRYRFYQQKGPAPLIFIIPGIGSSAYAGTARYLAEFLAGHGFHVLTLPSPFNWNFTLAASRSGFPGLSQEDARDLYAVMQLTLNAASQQCRAEIGKIGLVGLSAGARDAGFIGKLDAEQKKIGIERYLLINPPVNLIRAARQIDVMADVGKHFGTRQRDYLESYSLGVVADALQKAPDDPDYFLNWDTRTKLTDRQFKYLIGNELRKSVGDAIYTSSLIFPSGHLKTHVSWGHRSSRLKEAHSFSLMSYVEAFLIPRIRQLSNHQMTLDKLNTETSIKSIKTTLENNNAIFLMHNRDDFLVSGEDLAFLENVFGNRAKFYPRGGHLGNIWYSENKKDILDVFKPLLRLPTPPERSL